jgi:hypothetical protein
MRKVVLGMHVSLDGFAAGPNGEKKIFWLVVDLGLRRTTI